ncbi:complex I 24 kDa subunit family protein [Anaerofustis stercorihominis]|uniref:NADH dehydrogenase subunit E n=1 Tax=Anaerofustis stercorihominis DSM 17244 TaxID=445971 RepID=B1CAU3_9FIRM|nr:NAD(P)H-dependent oxidoreductase subunit E [Anaerofustis stercorihominis]EDS71390.1 putative NADH dehydrogenase subunit E [Anaerofustis stercorihominis DSM 17244]MCQ4795342.1 NAD(P)H-dependent oxidoreductase subunit E [Anaerofustis stercorihominis]
MKLPEEIKKVCKNIIEYYDNNPSDLLQIVLKIQRQIPGKFINFDIAKYIADEMQIPLSKVSEVVTYFDALSTKKRGKYILGLCNATACSLNGKDKIKEIFERELGIKEGETTEDGLFTLELVPCFGACDVAPAVRVNDNVVGRLNEEKIKALIAKLKGAK